MLDDGEFNETRLPNLVSKLVDICKFSSRNWSSLSSCRIRNSSRKIVLLQKYVYHDIEKEWRVNKGAINGRTNAISLTTATGSVTASSSTSSAYSVGKIVEKMRILVNNRAREQIQTLRWNLTQDMDDARLDEDEPELVRDCDLYQVLASVSPAGDLQRSIRGPAHGLLPTYRQQAQ